MYPNSIPLDTSKCIQKKKKKERKKERKGFGGHIKFRKH